MLTVISCNSGNRDLALVTITNSSNETIQTVRLSVCGQELETSDIHPGESRTFKYGVRSDSHYDLLVTFQSGKELKTSLGYVTHDMKVDDDIIVHNDAVELKDNLRR
jgi:hypothetical protein